MKVEAYQRKAHFYETDQMGIVHHSNYIRWFEECRVDYMEKIGYPYEKVEAKGISLAVLSVECTYKSMVRFGEPVAISMFISALSHSRMSIVYQVVDPKNGALLCSGKSSHCFYHNEQERPVALGKYAPDLYATLQEYLEEGR